MWDQLKKKKRYSQYVKEQVRPKVSVSLRDSLQETVRHHGMRIESPDRTNIIEVGHQYF